MIIILVHRSTVILRIISITKFSIVIGSPRAYLSRTVIGAQSRGYPITGVQFELFIIGHL